MRIVSSVLGIKMAFPNTRRLWLLKEIFKRSITAYKMSSSSPIEIKRSREEPLTIGTHSGTFHCDEALGCFMLRQLNEYKNAKIIRSRNIEELRKECDIILDVGSEFDHESKWYDHHQKEFGETLSTLRPELGGDFQIRLSSAGLIYAYYGERVIAEILKNEADITLTPEQLRLVYLQVYRNFVREIDAIDNGVPMYDVASVGEPRYDISTHVSKRIGKLNPSWEEEQSEQKIDLDTRFEQAMNAVGREFVDNVLEMGGGWIRAREIVRSALLNAKEIYPTGEILLLERFCPWKAHLADLEKDHNLEGVPKLVIFSDCSKNWRIAGVPIAPNSYIGRKFLPEAWRGLRDEELSKLAGVPGLIFAHHTGFIGGAVSKEASIAMAVKSLEWNNAA